MSWSSCLNSGLSSLSKNPQKLTFYTLIKLEYFTIFLILNRRGILHFRKPVSEKLHFWMKKAKTTVILKLLFLARIQGTHSRFLDSKNRCFIQLAQQCVFQ